jgi:hypothetical protein
MRNSHATPRIVLVLVVVLVLGRRFRTAVRGRGQERGRGRCKADDEDDHRRKSGAAARILEREETPVIIGGFIIFSRAGPAHAEIALYTYRGEDKP